MSNDDDQDDNDLCSLDSIQTHTTNQPLHFRTLQDISEYVYMHEDSA